MFFPSLRVNVMVSFVPLVKPILDERAKHAMLLVDAIEERTNVTMPTENTVGKLHGLGGGLHVLTFTQREARSSPADRFGAARFDPAPRSGATGASTNAVQLTPPSPAVDGWSSRRRRTHARRPARQDAASRMPARGDLRRVAVPPPKLAWFWPHEVVDLVLGHQPAPDSS